MELPRTRGAAGDGRYVERLASFAARCRDDGVPDDIRTSVRQRVVDILGICVAAQELETSGAAVDHALDSAGVEQSHVIGRGRRVPAAPAAFANGVLAHSLDYDDTHLPSVLHPSASVVPAGLAVAEMQGADGRDVVAAIAAGLEICVRLGMAGYDEEAGNSLFFEHGQHATSICGVVGSAATAALLMGLDAERVAHAMAISASFASGIIEGNRMGGTVKRTHCGWAAQGGVQAAQLAKRGFTGPPTVLEGRFGFYRAFLGGRFDADQLDEGLGTRWEIHRIFLKPYPANHFTHAGIDAAISLREQGVRPEDVESATLGIAAPTMPTIGDPIEVKRTPETGYQAQFSGPYTVAAAFFGGDGLGLGLGDFSERLVRDPARRELMARIDVVVDPRCDEIFPRQLPAVLRVRTRDGRDLEAAVFTSRGGPDRPLTEDEIRQKLRDNVRGWIGEGAVERIAAIVESDEALDDVGAVLRATS
ncbi:MAG: MmgE/PrpD family protein [Propionibacteriales bacterium]|nr:MmgE/PrpD family protein [Propionibacteriales bacterium]